MIEAMLSTGANSSGEALFTTTGTHLWTVPAGVEEVSVVTVGSGGYGVQRFSSGLGTIRIGGEGGALSWDNQISVTPGAVIEIVVPDSISGDETSQTASFGLHSFTNVYSGGVGIIGEIGDTSGGGGAGGYSGEGGNGGAQRGSSYIEPTSGQGGGAAGGDSTEDGLSGDGGGVGIFGEGESGEARTGGYGLGGRGGSGGQDGRSAAGSETMGLYGGGGSAGNAKTPGAQGVVRVIWGRGRSFPSTKTEQRFSARTETY